MIFLKMGLKKEERERIDTLVKLLGIQFFPEPELDQNGHPNLNLNSQHAQNNLQFGQFGLNTVLRRDFEIHPSHLRIVLSFVDEIEALTISEYGSAENSELISPRQQRERVERAQRVSSIARRLRKTLEMPRAPKESTWRAKIEPEIFWTMRATVTWYVFLILRNGALMSYSKNCDQRLWRSLFESFAPRHDDGTLSREQNQRMTCECNPDDRSTG
jgi:hypothetical protein